MGNNLQISYDLYKEGQNYSVVIAKIKTLGNWAKIHKSFWYVNSTMTAAEAVSAIWAVMDKNDTVYVVDATNKTAAWQNISAEAASYIKEQWWK